MYVDTRGSRSAGRIRSLHTYRAMRGGVDCHVKKLCAKGVLIGCIVRVC